MNIEPQSHDSQDHGPWIPWAEARLAIAQNAAHVFDVTLFFCAERTGLETRIPGISH